MRHRRRTEQDCRHADGLGRSHSPKAYRPRRHSADRDAAQQQLQYHNAMPHGVVLSEQRPQEKRQVKRDSFHAAPLDRPI
jgi:hypothetical protein